MHRYRFLTFKVLAAILFMCSTTLCFSSDGLSPYRSVKSSSQKTKFNIGGEWIAAEKIANEFELDQVVQAISKWDKPGHMSKFCQGLGKTFQDSFVQKGNGFMSFSVNDFGSSKSLMGCVFSWKTPKGNSFKTISTVEKGPDNVMYLFTLYR